MAGVDEGRLSASYGINIRTDMSGNAIQQAEELNRKIQALALYTRQAGDVAGASLVNNLSVAAQRVSSLQLRYKNLSEAISQGIEHGIKQSEIDDAVNDLKQIQKELDEEKKKLQEAKDALKEYGIQWEDAGDKAENGANSGKEAVEEIKNKLQDMAKFAGIAFTLDKAKDFVVQCVKVRGEMQALSAAFTTMLGSKQEADALLEQATEFAATTPFDLQDVATGAKQLLAYGTASEDIISEMEMLGNVASGLSQPLGDLVYLYGTLRASGRVTTMDIRQFAGRGIPIFEELSKVLGVTTGEVNELVSAGKVSFEQIQQAFRNMTSEGGKFAGLLGSQSDLINGKVSNLGDSVYQLQNKIGQLLEGTSMSLINTASASIEWLTENFETLGRVVAKLVVGYGAYKAALLTVYMVQKSSLILKEVAAYAKLVKQVGFATTNQVLFNKACNANPYILLASAVIGVVTALASFSKKNKEATKSQHEAADAIQREKDELEELYNVAKDENKSKQERSAAIAKINANYGDYLGHLIDENASVQDLQASYDKLTESIEQKYLAQVRESKLNVVQGNVKDRKSDIDAYIKRIVDNSGVSEVSKGAIEAEISKLFEGEGNVDKQDIYDILDKYSENILGKKKKGNFLNNKQVDIFQKVFKYNEAIDEYNNAVKAVEDFEKGYKSVTNADDSGKDGDLKKQETEETKTTLADLNKSIEAKKNELQQLRNAYINEGAGLTQEQEKTIEGLQEEIDNLTKRKNTLTGTLSSGSGKSDADNQEKAQEEVSKKRQSLFSDLAKGDIEQIKDATEKKVAALEQQRKEELAKLEQERKDLDAAIKKAGGAGLTDEDKAAFAKRSEQINTKYDDETIQIYDDAQEESNKAIEERIKAEQEANAKILSDKWAFLEQYGSIEEQRKAIIERYNKEIADADNGWAKNSLQQEMEQALKSLDFKQLKSSMNWDTVFGDISNVGNGDLVANRSKVSSFLSENRDSLGIDEIKDLEDALKSLDEELASRNPLLAIVTGAKEIGDAKEEYAASAEAFKQSLVEMQTAQQTYNDEVGIAQAARNAGILTETEYQAKLASAQNNLTKAQSKVTASSQRFQKAQNNVRQSTATLISGINEMTGMVKEGVEGIADFAGAFDSDLGDGISDAISVLRTFGGIAMDVVSELGKFGTDTVDTMKETAEQTAESIKQTSETTAASIKAIEAASVILLVIQAVIKTLTAITSIVKANKEADEEAAQAAYNYARALNTLARAQQLAQYDTNFGKDSFSSYTTSISQAGDALSKMNAEIEANKGATANISTGWEKVKKALTTLSGPSGTLKAMIEGQKAYANGISADFVADGRSKWQKFWGKNKNIATFNISEHLDENGVLKGDEFQAWYDEYKDKLSDEQKKTAEAILDNWDDYKESMEAISDYMDDLFSDMGENISDALVDAFKSGEDAAESLKEVAEEVIGQIIKDFAYAATIQPLINDAQEQIDKLNKENGEYSNISQEERMQKLIEITDGLIDNIAGAQEEYNTILQNAKDYAESKGYETLDNDDERSGEEKGIAQASQDSVDELNGRATAIQGHTYEINESVKGIMEQNRMLITSSGEILTQLMGIHRDTNSLDTRVGIIADGLEDIRTDLSWIRNKGVVAL